jgi:hypothetical protein
MIMGLDMYLTARRHVSNFRDEDKALSAKIRSELGMTDDAPGHINSISMRVMYWRKANQIHAWFVKNVQDGEDNCGEYIVTKEHLETLRDTINKVIATPNLAMELLPPQAGFFFGGTELDEYYWDDLKTTRQGIDNIISTYFSNSDFWTAWDVYYQSSW